MEFFLKYDLVAGLSTVLLRQQNIEGATFTHALILQILTPHIGRQSFRPILCTASLTGLHNFI